MEKMAYQCFVIPCLYIFERARTKKGGRNVGIKKAIWQEDAFLAECANHSARPASPIDRAERLLLDPNDSWKTKS